MNLESLLISQDAALLGVLRPALERISVDIQVCAEPRRGRDLLARCKFDAIIIDCDDLPEGFDLLKGLRLTQSNAKSEMCIRDRRKVYSAVGVRLATRDLRRGELNDRSKTQNRTALRPVE